MRRVAGILGLTVTAFVLHASSFGAAAGTVQGYVLFEIDGSKPDIVREKLRSSSLANCKQTLAGNAMPNEVIVHLACDERDDRNETRYMSQAVMELARIDGVKRATTLVVKRD
jgi:hypothetical protein